MGAVSGGGVLSAPVARHDGPDVPATWFDVEQYRRAPRRVVFRTVDRPAIVLGSTQRASLVDRGHTTLAGIAVARRRGGGGAVHLVPGAQVWADMWVPASDPLWTPEPRRTAVHVGRWWAAALARAGVRAAVHDGPSARTGVTDVACFAGVGPGEVLTGGRKVVGLAQWRSREGALVVGCAYVRFEPAALVDCLALDPVSRAALVRGLDALVVDMTGLGAPEWGAVDLLAELPEGDDWDVVFD
ncbi:MAG: lipoyl protein ligase domain-containing protein [Acidimicrobiales bacterium]